MGRESIGEKVQEKGQARTAEVCIDSLMKYSSFLFNFVDSFIGYCEDYFILSSFHS